MSLHDIPPHKDPSWVKKKRKRKRTEWLDDDHEVEECLLVSSAEHERSSVYSISDNIKLGQNVGNDETLQVPTDVILSRKKKKKERNYCDTSVVDTGFLETYNVGSNKLSQMSHAAKYTSKHTKRPKICEEPEQKENDGNDFKISDLERTGEHMSSSQDCELSSFSTSAILKQKKHKHKHRKFDCLEVTSTPKMNPKSIFDDQRDLQHSPKWKQLALHEYMDANNVDSGHLAEEKLNSTVAALEPQTKRKTKKHKAYREVDSEVDALLSSTSYRKHSKHKRLNKTLKELGCESVESKSTEESDAEFYMKSQTKSLPFVSEIKKSRYKVSGLDDDNAASDYGLHASSTSNSKTRHNDCNIDNQFMFVPKSESEHILVETTGLLHRKSKSYLPAISLDQSNSSESCKMNLNFPEVNAVKKSQTHKKNKHIELNFENTVSFSENGVGPTSKPVKRAKFKNHIKKSKPSKTFCAFEANASFANFHAKHESIKFKIKNRVSHHADNIAVDVGDTQTTTGYGQHEELDEPANQLGDSPPSVNVKPKKRKKHKNYELDFEVAVKTERSQEQSFNIPKSNLCQSVKNEKLVKPTKRLGSIEFSSELPEPSSIDINENSASMRHTINLNAAEYANLEKQAHTPEVFNLKGSIHTSGVKRKVGVHFDPVDIVSSSVDKALLLNSLSSSRPVNTARQARKLSKCFDESYGDYRRVIPTKSLKPTGDETSMRVANLNCVIDESANISRVESCAQLLSESEVKCEIGEPLNSTASESSDHINLEDSSADDFCNNSEWTGDLEANKEDLPANSANPCELQINISWPLSELHNQTLEVIKEDNKQIMKRQGIRYKEGRWTKEEEATLFRNWSKFQKEYKVSEISSLLPLPRKYNDVKRKFVQYLGRGLDDRPLIAIYHKIRQRLSKNTNSGRFTHDEVVKLKRLVETYGAQWQLISKKMNRNPTSLQVLYNRAFRQFKYSGKWNSQEDAKLIDIIQYIVGDDNFIYMNVKTLSDLPWEKISHLHGTRNGKQCRDRWYNQLYAVLSKNRTYYHWDEATIIQFLEILSQAGFKHSFDVNWVNVAEKLGSMTPGQLQHKWYQLKAKLARNLEHVTFEETVNYVLSRYKARLVAFT